MLSVVTVWTFCRLMGGSLGILDLLDLLSRHRYTVSLMLYNQALTKAGVKDVEVRGIAIVDSGIRPRATLSAALACGTSEDTGPTRAKYYANIIVLELYKYCQTNKVIIFPMAQNKDIEYPR